MIVYNSITDMDQDPLCFNWKIGARAGEGVMITTETFARACHRYGLQVFNYYEYPSLIKGGHQTGQVFASTGEANCQTKELDLLIALDNATLSEHISEITTQTIIIIDQGAATPAEIQDQSQSKTIYRVDLTNISREIMGTSLAANTAALGLSAYFLGLPNEIFHHLFSEQFSSKGEQIVHGNIAVFDAAYRYASSLGSAKFSFDSPTTQNPKQRILLTGGEAVGSAALASGLQYYAAYPMSPSSNTFHFIAAQQHAFPLVVRHAEDEIAAINLAVGASYAGLRSMTGTAGGGFALMVETISLTGVMELPLVVLVAMRPGPATGLPTWTSQGDLQFVIRAGHGEFQKIVLTPGSVEEHFHLTQLAFSLSEKYQIPVIILSDKYILEAQQSMIRPTDQYQLERYSIVNQESLLQDDSYRRFSLDTETGISPRSIPGQEHGLQLTNSYEHDEFGFATEDASQTVKQTQKRAKKLIGILAEIPKPYLIGPERADITFVCWGSTVNVLRQVVFEQSLRQDQKSPTLNVIHLPCLWPFPKTEFQLLTQTAQKLIMIEANFTSQAEQLIRQETGITFTHNLRRYDGRPFYKEDVVDYISKIALN